MTSSRLSMVWNPDAEGQFWVGQGAGTSGLFTGRFRLGVPCGDRRSPFDRKAYRLFNTQVGCCCPAGNCRQQS